MEIIATMRSKTNYDVSSNDCPVCPGCWQYMTVCNDYGLWKCWCDCVVGDAIIIPYQKSREDLITKQNEAISKYLIKINKPDIRKENENYE